MTYVLDTSSFIVIGHYFPDRFPTFWDRFNDLVARGEIVSVREVYRELDNKASRQHLHGWVLANRGIFLAPSPPETTFVAEIFSAPHFRHLLTQKQILAGGPAADPFVIASARVRAATVVTEETFRENAARIPNVCQHFRIACISLEGMMRQQGWSF